MFPKIFTPRWYSADKNTPIDRTNFEAVVAEVAKDSTPPQSAKLEEVSWGYPYGDALVDADGLVPLLLRSWTKKLPRNTMKAMLKQKIEQFKAENDDMPAAPRRVVAAFKEEIEKELAAKQVPELREVYVLVNMNNGDFLINEASATKADDMLDHVYDLLDKVYLDMGGRRPSYTRDSSLDHRVMAMQPNDEPEGTRPYLNWVLDAAAKVFELKDKHGEVHKVEFRIDDKVKLTTSMQTKVSVSGAEACAIAATNIEKDNPSQLEEMGFTVIYTGQDDLTLEWSLTMTSVGEWKRVKFPEALATDDSDSTFGELLFRISNVSRAALLYDLFAACYVLDELKGGALCRYELV